MSWEYVQSIITFLLNWSCIHFSIQQLFYIKHVLLIYRIQLSVT